jgi:hypothetical protein
MTRLNLFLRWMVLEKAQLPAGTTSTKTVVSVTTSLGLSHHILNVGGFIDAVFSVVAAFLLEDGNWFVAEIEAVEL